MRLVADNVSVARGGHIFFSGISFSLEAGEALVVSGPNGVGKSTFLRVLAGLLPDAEGSVKLDGAEFETAAEGAHYLGHRNGMKAELTVRENLEFWRNFMSLSDGDGSNRCVEVNEAVAMVGLDGLDHLPYGYLSAGQKRRIAMARLLTAYRPLWILDEPTAALDTQSQEMFSGLVANHLGSGGMVVAATHHALGLINTRHLVLTPDAPAVLSSDDPFAAGAPA
ncbi:MAG: heme ABC exporter ATP-binding protein CcmA [Hyphomicrobiales bacterium]|nr:heme ABC exporter ATP-binding protein CcmA [Hyphomicrobiales bacterium]MCP4997341.1 heme ABC exporter ATP-binding protein CcmA [Hyphomicrobiales bacterium]